MSVSVQGVEDQGRLDALASYDILDSPPEPAFDGIVELASQLCACPVALVSLVDRDRQWFKARVNFAPAETDLDSSVCAHALERPGDLLVIPDLRADPRTANNPLVTGDPFIRFYAGAPLVTAGGHVLGSLCVIDKAPRPEGLSPSQDNALRILARQVMAQLELRRALEVRDALAAKDAYRRALFDRLGEGFLVGEVIRDAARAITDWRYLEVNRAWGELVGVDPTTVVGRTLREVIPGIEEAWISDMAAVVETGEPAHFIRQVGSLRRWYEGRAFRLDGDRFGVFFLEATATVGATLRRDALLALGDRLRDLSSAEDMMIAASTALGTTLDVQLVGYGDIDPVAETITITRDWTSGGAQSLAGTLRFRDFGTYIEDLKTNRTVVVGDCRDDPRTSAFAAGLEALSARAFVNHPLFEHGVFVGLLYACSAQPRIWSGEEVDFIREVAARVRSAVARLRAEEQQALLNGELAHRLKNTLNMVLAIASQTLRGVSDQDAVKAFRQRVIAFSLAHDVLVQQSWTAASLQVVAEQVLALTSEPGRVALAGPAIQLSPQSVLSLSLLLHELATNAVKYGALSAPGGRVELSWSVERDPDPTLLLSWRETGGPPVRPPARAGFGSRLLRAGLGGEGAVDLRYEPEGFRAAFRSPLHHLTESG